METSDGIVEWVTLKNEKPIPPTKIPELVFEENKFISHKQNELGDEEREDDD